MIDIAEELQRRGVPAFIDVVGDGSLRSELEARTAGGTLETMVRFHGISYDMAQWYQQADVMLMTSRYEGIPYVIFEAMAMALPVVVPDVNANAELVDDAVGTLVPDRCDIDAYATALAELAATAGPLRPLGLAARTRVLERFRSRPWRVRTRTCTTPC